MLDFFFQTLTWLNNIFSDALYNSAITLINLLPDYNSSYNPFYSLGLSLPNINLNCAIGDDLSGLKHLFALDKLNIFLEAVLVMFVIFLPVKLVFKLINIIHDIIDSIPIIG